MIQRSLILESIVLKFTFHSVHRLRSFNFLRQIYNNRIHRVSCLFITFSSKFILVSLRHPSDRRSVLGLSKLQGFDSRSREHVVASLLHLRFARVLKSWKNLLSAVCVRVSVCSIQTFSSRSKLQMNQHC